MTTGHENLKVTCPGRPDGPFFEPWLAPPKIHTSTIHQVHQEKNTHLIQQCDWLIDKDCRYEKLENVLCKACEVLDQEASFQGDDTKQNYHNPEPNPTSPCQELYIKLLTKLKCGKKNRAVLNSVSLGIYSKIVWSRIVTFHLCDWLNSPAPFSFKQSPACLRFSRAWPAKPVSWIHFEICLIYLDFSEYFKTLLASLCDVTVTRLRVISRAGPATPALCIHCELWLVYLDFYEYFDLPEKCFSLGDSLSTTHQWEILKMTHLSGLAKTYLPFLGKIEIKLYFTKVNARFLYFCLGTLRD